MKLALMQPYFLPYIGYWQLLHAVDRFVVYDDVNYIKGGWINRNRILVDGRPAYLTVPVRKASSNRKINEHLLQPGRGWRDKMCKTLEHNYRKAPYFEETFALFVDLIASETESLAPFLVRQIHLLSAHLGIDTEIVTSSERGYGNTHLRGQERVLDICVQEGCEVYVNAIGGRELYSSDRFQALGLELRFLESGMAPYAQPGVQGFVPFLSILDVLMNLGRAGARKRLPEFTLI